MVPGAPAGRALSSTGTILIVAWSGFLVGFDGSLFTGAVVFVSRAFELREFELAWSVVSQTLAATLAIFVAGPLADRFGRRTVLRAAALVFAAAALMAAVASSFSLLIVARLLSGLGVGAVLVAAPMYIAEIAPPALRGRMVTCNQLFVVIGIFLAFCSNFLIVKLEHLQAGWLEALNLHDSNWRWMLGLGALPALGYLVALWFVPESPRWHALHGRFDAARRVFARAHGAAQAETEVDAVRVSLGHGGSRDATLRDLRDASLRGVVLIGIIVAVLQQITGINSVLAYATVIFQQIAGPAASEQASFLQTLLVGFVNLAATVVALLLIDRIGRRPLFLWGTAGIAVSLCLTAYGFHADQGAMDARLVLAGLLGFVACFAFSLGPGLWVLLSEIFPNRVRALAISCIGLINSSVCVAVQFAFPWQMAHVGGANTFLLYAAFAVLGLLLLARYLPETRGRSLEELEADLVRHEDVGRVR